MFRYSLLSVFFLMLVVGCAEPTQVVSVVKPDIDSAGEPISTGKPGSTTEPVSPGQPPDRSDDDEDDNADDDDQNTGHPTRPEFAESLRECAESLGTSTQRIVLLANKSTLELTTAEALVVELGGNKSSARVRIVSEDPEQVFKGVCVLAKGNKSSFSLEITGTMGKLVFLGKGNKSQGQVVVESGAKLESLSVRLKGNKSSFAISGAGTYPCASVVEEGNKTQFSCAQ